MNINVGLICIEQMAVNTGYRIHFLLFIVRLYFYLLSEENLISVFKDT